MTVYLFLESLLNNSKDKKLHEMWIFTKVGENFLFPLSLIARDLLGALVLMD